MNIPPSHLDGAKVLQYAILDEQVVPTGKHQIWVEEKPFRPKGVAICQYKQGDVFYVFYCNDKWEVITDMDEISLDEAIASIKHGYKGVIFSTPST